MSLLAELCALLGDARRAQRLYELMIAYEGRNVVFLGAAYLGPVARYLGLLAMTIGEGERALAHLETARSAAERMGARPTVVLTTLDAAELLARRGAMGDAQRGRALAERVARDAAQQQMDGALTRITELRQRFDSRGGASARRPQRATLARDQGVWFLGYGGCNFCLQDAKGMRHLATLLSQPNMRVAAVALAATGEDDSGDPPGTAAFGAGPSATYRERAADLREELAQAQAFNDPERVVLAQEQLESLASELAALPAPKGAAVERARINVTRSIRAALRRIAEHDAELGALLQSGVRTGALCCYEPDPGMPLHWDVHS